MPPKKGQKHVMRVVREILGAEPERTGHRSRGRARDAVQRRAPAQRRLRAERLLHEWFRAHAVAGRGTPRRDSA